jgi:hypothetical protein
MSNSMELQASDQNLPEYDGTNLRFGILIHSTNSTYAYFKTFSSPSVRYLRKRFFRFGSTADHD